MLVSIYSGPLAMGFSLLPLWETAKRLTISSYSLWRYDGAQSAGSLPFFSFPCTPQKKKILYLAQYPWQRNG